MHKPPKYRTMEGLRDMSLETKDVSSVIALSTPAITTSESLVLDGSRNLKSVQFATQLALMLMPWAKICHVSRNTTERADWILYATAPTYWSGPGFNTVGDVLIISGTTTDTGQRLLYYFVATSKRDNTYMNGKCFLFLLEGEPPIIPNITT